MTCNIHVLHSHQFEVCLQASVITIQIYMYKYKNWKFTIKATILTVCYKWSTINQWKTNNTNVNGPLNRVLHFNPGCAITANTVHHIHTCTKYTNNI